METARNSSRILVALGGVAILIVTAISPAIAGSIANGEYSHEYPDNQFIEIKNGRFRVHYDGGDPPTNWMPMARQFKPVKKGIILNLYDKKYYCGFKPSGKGALFKCTRNGWIKSF
jgi:hypothetical protein